MLGSLQEIDKFIASIDHWLPEDGLGPMVELKPVPDTWRERVREMFASYFWHPFSEPHVEMWRWVDAIELDSAPQPFCAFWPRGRGKSTVAEAAVADLCARKMRIYAMYVSGTQDQADKHVQTIARMLESADIAQFFPDVGKPLIGKNGSRTWNRSIVTASNGVTVEAIGLNKAVRGQKIDWARPDLIVFDDVDEKHDTEHATEKKEQIMTDSILPAGAANCAVLFVQNLIHADSIASKLAKSPGEAEAAGYLMDRIISGPFPAIEELEYEARQVADGMRWIITEGRSIWRGFSLDTCEREINRVGPTSYLLESQHEVDTDNPNALLSEEDFDRTRMTEHPDLARVAIGVDPPGGATECGIVCGGKAKVDGDWHGYTLEDASAPAGCSPEEWALAVLKCYHRNKADAIYVEKNYGGDMVESTIRQTKWKDDGRVIVDGSKVKIVTVWATRGKQVRAEPVGVVFEQGRGHHVGHFPALEKEWRQWEPGDSESPNRLDAEVWLYTGLELIGESGIKVAQANLYEADERRDRRSRRSGGLYGSRR